METSPVDKATQLLENLVLSNFVTASINGLDITECYEYTAGTSVTVTDGASLNEVGFIQLKFDSISATDYSFIILLSYFGNTANTANYTARVDFITATLPGVPINDVTYTLPFATLPIYPDADVTHVYNSALCPAPVPLVACPVWGFITSDLPTEYEEGSTAVLLTQAVTGDTTGWTYQWTKETYPFGSPVNIPLATNITYTVPITETNGLYLFKCVTTPPLGNTCDVANASVSFIISTNCQSTLCADPNFQTTAPVAENTPVDYTDGFFITLTSPAYYQTLVDALTLTGCYTATVTGDDQVDLGSGARNRWVQVKFQALNDGDVSFIYLLRFYGNDSDQTNFTLKIDWVKATFPVPINAAMNDVAFVFPYLPTVIADPTHYYLPTGTVCS